MPRKPLKTKNKNVEDVSNNRIAPVLDLINGTEHPDELMSVIVEVLTETEIVPKIGNYYTFRYMSKTPNLKFDEYPLVQVTQILPWGFKAINYHYPGPRQYTWEEMVSSLHIIKSSEIKSLLAIPYKKLRLNN